MKRSAFTLVELLIVMAVIAALISVVAPMGLNALKQARTVQVATDLRAARDAIIGKVAAYGVFVSTGDIDVSKSKGYKTTLAVAAVGTSAYTVTIGSWTTDRGKYDADYLNAVFGTDFSSTSGAITVSATPYIYN